VSARARVPDTAVRALSGLLLERVGLRPVPESEAGLRLAILARLDELGNLDAAAYVERLERGDREELRALLPLVTVGKTEFFRDASQVKALRTTVLPQLLSQARSEQRPLRIWSAGCATGEEPFSIAMLVAELDAAPEEVDLLATDVNPEAVIAAAQGRFPARRMAAVPKELLERYWVDQGGEYVARPSLSGRVRFAIHNLAGSVYPVPRGAPTWDLLLCRNVIIYFDGSTTLRVVRRFFERLREGGVLCLGYSESLYRLSGDFELAEVDGAFLYRRPCAARPRDPPPAPGEEAIVRLREAVAMRRRKPALAPVHAPAPPLGSPAPSASPPLLKGREPLSVVADELEAGRFEVALATLLKALERAPQSLALQITLGNVLTLMRREADARAAYQTAIALEPLCMEAHLFLGILCFEEGAKRDGDAARELTRALFLDPDCALGHYYLGRLFERRGDPSMARRSYRNAVESCRSQGDRGPLLGYYPDLPTDPAVLRRAASYALAALAEK
jgi:chemotaxis protein methyltransferase CheR